MSRLIIAVLIPPLGAAGAALGTLAAELAVLIAQGILGRDILRDMPRVSWGSVVMSTALATAAAGLVKAFAPIGSVYVLLAAELIVFGGVYLAASMAAGEPLLREEILARRKDRK